MPSRGQRADFSRTVAEKLAKRAAYKCSFPTCIRSTTGPGANEDQVSTTGKAAHIYSASQNGPRGTGGLTLEQRQRIDNGIWLCAKHADLVDKNGGTDFPVPTLREYRRIHEERIRSERALISGSSAWVHSMTINSAPIFKTPLTIHFGKVTVICGENHSGKTALCDWLQGISNPLTLCSWADALKSRTLSYEVTYFDPFEQRIRVRTHAHDEVEYFLNGEPTPFDPNPIRFVRLKYVQLDRRDHGPQMTDLEFLSRTLSVSPALIRNMLPLVGVQQASTVGGVRLETTSGDALRLHTDVHGTLRGLDLRYGLSNTERCRVLLEIAAVFARHSAKRVPTVLLIDWAAKSFDNKWMKRVLDFLSEDGNRFQTVIERVAHGLESWEAARTINLIGNKENVTTR